MKVECGMDWSVLSLGITICRVKPYRYVRLDFGPAYLWLIESSESFE